MNLDNRPIDLTLLQHFCFKIDGNGAFILLSSMHDLKREEKNNIARHLFVIFVVVLFKW